jgi:hypothetical protein
MGPIEKDEAPKVGWGGFFIRFVLLLAIPLISACGTSPTYPEGTADASGLVREILAAPVAPHTVGRVLVEHTSRPVPGDRSIVHIGRETELLLRTRSGSLRPIQIEEIRVGASATIRIRDYELRSYPRQVFAIRIVVSD